MVQTMHYFVSRPSVSESRDPEISSMELSCFANSYAGSLVSFRHTRRRRALTALMAPLARDTSQSALRQRLYAQLTRQLVELRHQRRGERDTVAAALGAAFAAALARQADRIDARQPRRVAQVAQMAV